MSARKSEDILLQVGSVKVKKSDGILFVMESRLGWMVSNKDSFTINLNYRDIKSQKISPEGKAKIQLQIVMHDGSNTTFHFVNPGGREAQIKDRDSAKDRLQQLLPKFKIKVNKELEEKNRKLTENPGLLQLYKDLVITEIITAQEFWETHGQLNKSLNNEHDKSTSSNPKSTNNKTSVNGNSSDLSSHQQVGVSGAFLSEIKPQADGANGLKYNLTGDIINSIFKTYPPVKRKHLENVPSKMSEQEFWSQFFQSHYFHRDRILHKGVKDLFTECARDDDKSIKVRLNKGVPDTTANIGRFNDSTLDENYGIGDLPPDKNSINIVHRNIIKRFNHHSIMVMSINDNQSSSTTPNNTTTASSSSSKDVVVDNKGENKRLAEKTNYEDLMSEPPKKTAKLDLAKSDRYLNGPTPVTCSTYLTTEELFQSRKQLLNEISVWKHQRSKTAVSSAKALKTLTDLTPGGALMKGAQQDAIAETCPQQVQQDMKQLYISLGELLRHFWGCFPPTSQQLQEKASKMFDTLKKFEAVKVRPFENELNRTYNNSGAKMTAHINRMLESAYRKYSTWQQKKLPKL